MQIIYRDAVAEIILDQQKYTFRYNKTYIFDISHKKIVDLKSAIIFIKHKYYYIHVKSLAEMFYICHDTCIIKFIHYRDSCYIYYQHPDETLIQLRVYSSSGCIDHKSYNCCHGYLRSKDPMFLLVSLLDAEDCDLRLTDYGTDLIPEKIRPIMIIDHRLLSDLIIIIDEKS